MLSNKSVKVAAIIAAGGSGVRMKADIPKQFLYLHDKPIIVYTLEKFLGCSGVGKIFLIVPKAEMTKTELLLKKWNIPKAAEVIAGGKTRQHSVWNGLCRIPDNTEIVMVHDGVRPFISVRIINKCIKETEKWGAVITAIPVYETVKEVVNHCVRATLDRSKLWRVQTPQSFKKELLIEAYKKAWEADVMVTDDSSLVEQIGYKVKVVKGEEKNIKITSPEDMIIAEKFI